MPPPYKTGNSGHQSGAALPAVEGGITFLHDLDGIEIAFKPIHETGVRTQVGIECVEKRFYIVVLHNRFFR